ncbi:beclin-2 [Rhynchonycteris naso]
MSALRFLCQCCHQPLRLTQSMETLGCDTSQEPLVSKLPLAQGEPGETPEQGSASKVRTDVGKLQDGASGGTLLGHGKKSWSSSSHFTLLGKLDSGRTLSSIQKTTRGIFDILAGEDLDHPLCEDCTDNLLEQLDTQLAISESESQNYSRCLETREGSREDEREALQEELNGLELEKARLVQELEQVERTRVRAVVALQAAQAETEMLGQQERQHHADYSKLQWQQLELSDELESLENQLRYAQTQLALLEKTDAFRSAFEIRHDGPLAIINNFRLGYLPNVPVSWDEINAAWGQMALLLLALSNTVGLQFQRYRLVPCGNHSYLKSLTGDGAELPLFCSSALLYNKFDRAMTAFLDCMQQFKEEAEKGKQGLHMPCRIHAGRGLIEAPGAGGELYSIRTHSNTEERWTKALKLMLTNFKWTLAWVSLKYGQK